MIKPLCESAPYGSTHSAPQPLCDVNNRRYGSTQTHVSTHTLLTPFGWYHCPSPSHSLHLAALNRNAYLTDGFISDSIPLFGYRRRSYLVAAGLLGAASWTMLATWVDTPYGTVGAMLFASLSTAFSDVVVDSIVVERSRGAPQVGRGACQRRAGG